MKSNSIQLKLGGMGCVACARRIETTLQNLEGVTGVSVNFATEKATVQKRFKKYLTK